MFYLSRYIGSGTDSDPYRPALFDAVDGCSSVDLRADAKQQAGWSVVHAPSAASADARWVTLSDDPDDTSDTVRQTIQSRLGLTLPSGVRLRRLLLQLLLNGKTDGTRFRPLLPAGVRYELWLGRQLLDSLPFVAGGAGYADAFNRADSTSIGSSWTEVQDDFTIASNKLSLIGASSGTSAARYEADLVTDAQRVQADITWQDNTARVAALALRFDPADNTYYRVGGSAFSDIDVISKTISGTTTNLATQAHTIGGETDHVTATADGSTITVTVGSGTLLSVTDTGITGNKRTGVAAGIMTGSSCQWDNWQASDLRVARSFGGGAVAIGPSTGDEKCIATVI